MQRLQKYIRLRGGAHGPPRCLAPVLEAERAGRRPRDRVRDPGIAPSRCRIPPVPRSPAGPRRSPPRTVEPIHPTSAVPVTAREYLLERFSEGGRRRPRGGRDRVGVRRRLRRLPAGDDRRGEPAGDPAGPGRHDRRPVVGLRRLRAAGGRAAPRAWCSSRPCAAAPGSPARSSTRGSARCPACTRRGPSSRSAGSRPSPPSPGDAGARCAHGAARGRLEPRGAPPAPRRFIRTSSSGEPSPPRPSPRRRGCGGARRGRPRRGRRRR
ncbi:hypothetical protein SAMN05216505_11988 [Streptomyces prasinopilosus]|uniref:Uncharacterized protein n=1 Tax=Streptomyces prasinopilosus TaxID=67344 RepID=A0A1G7AUU8_9ACTN|nr:hypothetical protein SAMN05216505_11988 [Streptomyces prasinopilosus]